MIKKLLLSLMVVFLCSCAAHKKVPYFQDLETSIESQGLNANGQIKIGIDDLLSIEVTASNPKVTEPFNLNTSQTTGSSSSNSLVEKTFGYLVDANGDIDFPVVGKLKVVGLTNIEASDLIRESLSDYLKERPVVRIRIINFQITVLGEVASPGVVEVDSERVNIFEALALAGDMTLYGVRNNVKLVRTLPNGKSKVVTLNLMKSNIIDSEYYYLQQNDVIYVQPNKSKANTSAITSSSTIWITFTSALMSIASFIMAFVL